MELVSHLLPVPRKRKTHRLLLFDDVFSSQVLVTVYGFLLNDSQKEKREELHRKECFRAGTWVFSPALRRESLALDGWGTSGVFFLGNVFCASCLSRETDLWVPSRSWFTCIVFILRAALSYVANIQGAVAVLPTPLCYLYQHNGTSASARLISSTYLSSSRGSPASAASMSLFSGRVSVFGDMT